MEAAELTRLLPLLPLGLLLLIGYIATQTSGRYSLDRIKRRTVGDGQHGTARWATARELQDSTHRVAYTPDLWRRGINLPRAEGLVIHMEQRGRTLHALVDTSDSHTLLVAGPMGGKTTGVLIPNIEYALASGMSFISTDSKGTILEAYGGIAAKDYGYRVYVIDYRHPEASHGANLCLLVNKYFDEYRRTGSLRARSLAERHAKIVAKSIVYADGFTDGGQNAFFYDAAEGLIAATCLLVTEFCRPGERHIVTVFKLILEMMEDGRFSSQKKPTTRFQELMALLPPEHKAKWLAGAASRAAGQSFASVISTAMSRLLSFIDTEAEQILSADAPLSIEDICEERAAVFIVFPEEDRTKHVLVSLQLTQLYNAAMTWADTKPGQTLPRRLYFYEDEFGIFPRQDNVEQIFAASRSRNIILVPAIQATSQLNKSYGQNGMKTIFSCCQSTIYGGFSPLSDDLEYFSKRLGNQTVAAGSVSQSSNEQRGPNQSRSTQMIGRPLMTPDELKHMPHGQWVVDRKSLHPFLAHLPHYSECGIKLDQPYQMAQQPLRTVQYGSCDAVEAAIRLAYAPHKNTLEPFGLPAAQPRPQSLKPLNYSDNPDLPKPDEY